MDKIRLSRLLFERLEQVGIAPADVVRLARLPHTLLQQERISVSLSQWFALWHALGEISDDPAIGLKFSNDAPVVQHNPLSIAALSARSFGEGVGKMARYKRLFCSEDLRMVAQDGAWHIDVVWIAMREPAPPLLIDVIFASLLELGRQGTGRALYPERVAFARAPQHRAMYTAYFHCPVDFDAARNLIVYSAQAMDQPFRTYNPELLELIEPQLEVALRDAAARQQCTEQVKTLLRSRLAAQQPTMQDIARELNISARTLQRRLADEGAHFQQLLETVRREMAQHYLAASALDLSEIAYLLGYEEASSFHRAFQHWEGTTPGQWRAAQMR